MFPNMKNMMQYLLNICALLICMSSALQFPQTRRVSLTPKIESCTSTSFSSEGQEVERRRAAFSSGLAVLATICTVVSVQPDFSFAADTSTPAPTANVRTAVVVKDTRDSAAVSTDFKSILEKAAKKAGGGGKSGAAAAGVQVLTLMWLRTTMNYQYRNGGTTSEAIQKLYKEGGIPRLYQGLPFALVQGPLSRFGDTAANSGVLLLLDSLPATSGLPLVLKTAGGSVAAGLWRIILTPIDTLKTSLQVSGSEGIPILVSKVKSMGPSALFQGALATSAATAVGSFPWWATYNSLDANLAPAPPDAPLLSLGRAALLGICASTVSDCCSNSIRVVKTAKQTSPDNVTYRDALDTILAEGGLTALFTRGLQTRLLVNALQGGLFSVLWRYFESQRLG